MTDFLLKYFKVRKKKKKSDKICKKKIFKKVMYFFLPKGI